MDKTIKPEVDEKTNELVVTDKAIKTIKLVITDEVAQEIVYEDIINGQPHE